MTKKAAGSPRAVESFIHGEAVRRNIPTAEHYPVMEEEHKAPVLVACERRNRDLDPQLVWSGKNHEDDANLTVSAPPLYIQEKIHPKALIDDLARQSARRRSEDSANPPPLFDFNGLPDNSARTEFYEHDGNWSNRMILGDSLQVMASLAEREGLRGKVQCVYIDPPYGIRFQSNFQWSTTGTNVKDGKPEHITREPEQVKAFRDTWRNGIHSYLAYLRDRLVLSRELLADSGSVFVQIGDENVHRVRSIMDEVFGEENFVSQIQFRTKIPLNPIYIGNICDFIIWYGKDRKQLKFRRLFRPRKLDSITPFRNLRMADESERPCTREELMQADRLRRIGDPFRLEDLVASGRTESCHFEFLFDGKTCYPPGNNSWKTSPAGVERLKMANRIRMPASVPRYQFRYSDYPVMEYTNQWVDTQGAIGKRYVVETAPKVVQRCMLMATDPGDLVLDPTCGSGTSAFVAERWGRRWIAIDTSRVALALARARLMGACFPWYRLADSPEGRKANSGELQQAASDSKFRGDIRQGFVYERVPHVTMGSIAQNAEIDVIWEEHEARLKPLRERISSALGLSEPIDEWNIPRRRRKTWPESVEPMIEEYWDARIKRQKEIDNSIAANARQEQLYDRPCEDKSRIRVTGPFTVESVAPHRMLSPDEDGRSVSGDSGKAGSETPDFLEMMLESLRSAGVQQTHREDRIAFDALVPWPGNYICAEGSYKEGAAGDSVATRAGIFVGPEFGTVARPDLAAAAREAAEAGFDVLIACAFSYDAHAAEIEKVGRLPVLKARMNADLHMAADLKNTGKGNLFVVFGEPDVDILEDGDDQLRMRVNGVDIFDPGRGEVRSNDLDGIACWFVDTDYNEESFFVRHAYFLGAKDQFDALKTTLKAEIDADAWKTLRSNVSRPFPKPASGRIAVKVINHLGDEVMKVFRVG